MKKIKFVNGYYGLSLILVLFLIANISYFPHFYSDMTIKAPSIASVGESFIISGTSRMAAAERVNLYILDSKEPISHAVVGIKPPFVYEFEVLVSSHSLTINGIVFDSGPIEGKTIQVYVESNNQQFISSPVSSIKIEP
ncbi:hypothetical protein [[Eubacterium] cellulosolvens]